MTRDDGAWGTWSYGDVAVRREALKGHPWTAIPTYVVSDTADLLVTYIAPGTTIGLPDYPYPRWEHPWKVAGHTTWFGHGKLMMQRPGEAYSVDVFWRGDDREFAGWYLNLQDPLTRDASGYDTLDHELDYWMPAEGGWVVKDAELFEQRVAEERYTAEQAGAIRRTGQAIESMLTTGATWWDESWARWTPPGEWGPLPALR
jgi:hypothetical protein